jgi:hypothetical protein
MFREFTFFIRQPKNSKNREKGKSALHSHMLFWEYWGNFRVNSHDAFASTERTSVNFTRDYLEVEVCSHCRNPRLIGA